MGVGALAAAALLIAGCGSSSHAASASAAQHTAIKKGAPAKVVSAQSTIGSAAISRAADVSGAAKGEKVAYTLNETVPSLGKLTLTGTGTFNNSPAEGQMSLNVAIPGASSLGAEAALLSNLQLQLVIEKQAIYFKLPSSLSTLASSFTNNKPWLELDLAKLGSGSKIAGLSDLLGGSTSPTNPGATLKQLAAASTNGVKQIGPATVDGVSTTEYSADLDFSKLSSSLPASLRASMKQQLAKAEKQLGISSVPIDVYIDSANLIRRVAFNLTTTVAGAQTPVSLQMDFLSYGAQAAPTVPAAADTFNADSLLGSLASGGAASLLGG